MSIRNAGLPLLLLTAAACAEPSGQAESPAEPGDGSVTAQPHALAGRQPYFGDLHVHTVYSLDAFVFGTRATPDDAYRYARGEAIRHPGGFDVQLDRPLDFTAVTDHAMFLGNLAAWADGRGRTADHPLARRVAAAGSVAERAAAFREMRDYVFAGHVDELLDLQIVRSAWQEIRDAAERHNQPGTFTTFVAYEYTSAPDQNNLHRNVIFASAEAPEMPFSRLDSANPERLWDWMDDLRDRGIEALAIPHNANGSNGAMFALTDSAGAPLDAAYAERRRRNEPLVEITQVKGTSETHPALSPNDEWAGFEIMPYRVASWLPSAPSGSYVREALGNGIRLEATRGFNPFQLGIVGASDTHTGAASLDEADFFGKVGLLDATPELRGSVPLAEPAADGHRYRQVYYPTWGAAGLTGIWAEQNERAALYAALRRRETFATSGPRLVVRMFAGFDLPPDGHREPDWAEHSYRRGVPMGGDLVPGDGPLRLLVAALKDPAGAPLQRLQVVKGWVDGDDFRERVFDVACADGARVDPASHRCPDNGARVDTATCAISADLGASELATTWEDSAFDPAVEAFYYARVLENPTCRWSTWDAVRAGVAPREDLPATIQERAWSSPVWYHPGQG